MYPVGTRAETEAVPCVVCVCGGCGLREQHSIPLAQPQPAGTQGWVPHAGYGLPKKWPN